MRTALALIAVLLIVLANGVLRGGRVRAGHHAPDARPGAGRAGQPRRPPGVRTCSSNPARFISAIQLGVTLSSLALGAIGEPVVSNLLETPLGWLPDSWHGGVALTISAILAFSILSFFHVVLGEIVPKSYTLQHAERVALVVATPIDVFYAIFRPFIWALVAASEAVLRWLGLPPRRAALVGALRGGAEDAGHGQPRGGRARGGGADDAPQGVRVRRQGRGRRDGAAARRGRAADSRLPVARAAAAMLDSPYTRYPVYEGELDDVVGVLHVRDLFAALHDRGIDGVDVRGLLRPAIVVPETKRLDELLAEFRATSNHMAIVVDEYGSLAGLVTLEDLLEEIVRRDRRRVRPARFGHPAASGGDGCGSAGRSRSRSSTSASAPSLPDEDYHSDRRLRVRRARAARRGWATRSRSTACGSR